MMLSGFDSVADIVSKPSQTEVCATEVASIYNFAAIWSAIVYTGRSFEVLGLEYRLQAESFGPWQLLRLKAELRTYCPI